jgi:D-allulose-6-phosphate 3-epimerase
MVAKVQELKALKQQHGHKYLIEIDGSCNTRTYNTLVGAGAEVLIVGTSGLFNIHDDLATAWDMMRDSIDEAQGLAKVSA